jgi:hypothetical protein
MGTREHGELADVVLRNLWLAVRFEAAASEQQDLCEAGEQRRCTGGQSKPEEG